MIDTLVEYKRPKQKIKMPKFMDNIKSLLSNKKENQNNNTINKISSDDSKIKQIAILETDAAPVSLDEDDSDVDSNYNDQSRTSSITSQISSLNLNNSLQRQESLTPLKQHRIVEATTFNNSIVENNNQQLVPSSNYENDNRVATMPTHATLNQTQAQNVFQISHASGVHIGNVFSFNSGAQNNVNEPRSPSIMAGDTPPPSGLRKSSSQSSNGYAVTKTISEMMKSSLAVDEKFLDVIATHLINWKDIARKLDYTEGQIDHFYADNYVYGAKETVYQMLLDWMRNSNEPALGILTRILWRNNNQEAVLYLKPIYKAKKMELLQKSNTNDNL